MGEGCTPPCRQSRPSQSRSSGTEESVFSAKRLLFSKSYFKPTASFALEEHPLRTKLIICTEVDYLQAHLTVIEGKSRGSSLTLHNAKQRVTSVLKKWILAVNDDLPAQSNSLRRFRAIGASQRFWAGSDLAKRRSGCPPPRGTRKAGKQS